MKILVRLPNWLGDSVMSIAFIDALKKVYPEYKTDIIVRKELRDILSYCDNVNEIYEFSKAEFPGLRGAYRFGKMICKRYKYDIFFCLPNSFSSAWMGFFTGSKIRIGYKKEFRNFMLTHSYKENKDLHRAEEYVNLLNMFKEIQIPIISVALKRQPNISNLLPKGKNLLLNINSEAQSRKMPVELAKRLIIEINSKYDFNYILIGNKKDIPNVSQLESKLNSVKSIYNYAGKTNLLDLIKIVSEADYIISTDSGVAHIGNAFSINTIVLFGAGDEKKTRPYNTKNLKIIRKYGLDCAPCVSNNCKYGEPICLTELDTKKVLQGLDELVEKTEADSISNQ
jgi:heptosyltransferase-2